MASHTIFLTMVPMMVPAEDVLGCPSAASITKSMKMVNRVMDDASFSSDSPSSTMRSRSGPPPGGAQEKKPRVHAACLTLCCWPVTVLADSRADVSHRDSKAERGHYLICDCARVCFFTYSHFYC